MSAPGRIGLGPERRDRQRGHDSGCQPGQGASPPSARPAPPHLLEWKNSNPFSEIKAFGGSGRGGLGSRVQIDSALGVQGPTNTWVAFGAQQARPGCPAQGPWGGGRSQKSNTVQGPRGHALTCITAVKAQGRALGEEPEDPAPGGRLSWAQWHPVRFGNAILPGGVRHGQTNGY